MNILEAIKNRLPKKEEVLPVYAVGVLIFYTFSLWTSMTDLSRNWIRYLSGWEIVGVLSYILVAAWIESILLLAFLLVLRMVVPTKWAAGRFVSYGTITTVAFLGSLMIRDGTYVNAYDLLPNEGAVILSAVLSSIILWVISEKVSAFRRGVETFADRSMVFLYVYPPLSVAALVIVLIRNIG